MDRWRALTEMVGDVMVCAAAPRFLYWTGEWHTRSVVIAVLAAVAFAGILVVFVGTNIDGPWRAGIIGGIAWFGCTAAGFVALLRYRPDVLRHIGLHETPMRSEIFVGHLDTEAATMGPGVTAAELSRHLGLPSRLSIGW